MRLDQYVTNELKISRNKAQVIIKSWNVLVDSKIITKTGFEITENNKIIINELEQTKYVARSAIKLKWFFEKNDFNLKGFVCLDIWSSTWWFCQILLENWASKIYAVDVWTSQLHESIKSNTKIITKENTDVRKLDKLNENIDLITCDVSFISLELIIDSIINHMNNNTICILLFKPQFEVGKKNINKKWVVTDQKISDKKLNNFLQVCRDKWLKINNVENSSLQWENWNKEIFIEAIKK